MMQLAKLFHSRGFHITFVNTDKSQTFNPLQGSGLRKGLPDFRFETIPDGLPPSDRDATQYVPGGSEAQNCLKSSAIIFNTFDEFEQEVLEAITSKFPNIYTIGPLPLLCRHVPDSSFKSFTSSLWKEDSECLKWLDKREPNSVVYVNYGSVTVMTDQHLKEFAWGLANSKHPFLWIVRPDVVMGDSAVLPEEYFEEIKDRGLIASWCSQEQVLTHPSVGVFLTHCGWNSTVESVCVGVPVICWPFFADQQTNCRYACTTWGIGMEVNEDVKRDDIEALVKEMMQGDKGKQMRQKAQDWKQKAEATTDIGGKSYNNFNRLIKEALHHRN
ncbi:linamarin synthase 2-like [Pistacia vera]|uniref:linamarin synthase 2-like n=1 Tax=Pistacia vera TaxID=55513 RepID=UPI0012632C8C|nr:linamarin synthase 2-like [Pistacia vera]